MTQCRAEDATRAKTDFLASMSHELRTPLNAIILVSRFAMTNDRDMALAAGGDDFDTKPIRFLSLPAKIQALLARTAATS